MACSERPHRSTALVALFVCFVAANAFTGEASAQSSEEIACRDAVADSVRRYSRATLRVVGKCHKLRSRGKLPLTTDCNHVASGDPTDRLARDRDRLRDAVGSCSDAPGVLASYARCPSPAQTTDDGGTSDGIDDLTELGECLIGLVDGVVEQGSREAYGLPADVLASGARKCQKTLGKRFEKTLLTVMVERARCQRDRDEAGQGLDYGCGGQDPSGRIESAVTKARNSVAAGCNVNDDGADMFTEVNRLGSCGDTATQLQDCAISGAAVAAGSGLVSIAYDLPADCRAGGMLRVINAAYGSQITESDFSAGWAGVAHEIDLTDRFRDRLFLDCDADCANCGINLDVDKTRADSFCRCDSDPTVSCDVINGADPDDCTGTSNVCSCFFGPPAGVAASGTPACVLVKTTAPQTGTIDLGTGQLSNDVEVAALIYLGSSTQQPCPICAGDTVPNDGVRAGTCGGGNRDGDPCDENAVQPTFGPASYDCLPNALTNISGGGLPLDLTLTTADSSLPFALPCDTAGESCPCRVCSGDSAIGCSSDARCEEFGAGACTASGGAGNQANACNDGVCNADGECGAGPVDKYCDGTTYADGSGYITCLSDLDCSFGGHGACQISERRKCYTDPITVDGRPGVFGAKLGAISCIGVTTSAAINLASGLPGAVRLGLDVDLTPTCGNLPNRAWDPPSGSNCIVESTPTTTTTTTTLLGSFDCDTFVPPLCGQGTCSGGGTCTASGLACMCSP
jgi:hypothetical protein